MKCSLTSKMAELGAHLPAEVNSISYLAIQLTNETDECVESYIKGSAAVNIDGYKKGMIYFQESHENPSSVYDSLKMNADSHSKEMRTLSDNIRGFLMGVRVNALIEGTKGSTIYHDSLKNNYKRYM